jgi:NAD-dependent SIR2 family protein deacetylase
MSTIDDVAKKIQNAELVVFLTGAGLSVASGIRPYRKSKDAVWSNIIMDWGTVEKFNEDPVAWYREFWFKAHGEDSLDGFKPNPGHDAITKMVTRSPEHLVVTQNIDGLHRKAGVPEKQLVEIHGRADRFMCTDDDCVHRHKEPILNTDVALTPAAIAAGNAPKCPKCGSPVRPLVLLFDEMYESHSLYRMRDARRALNDANVIVFVGTSFSVGITEYAIRAGEYARAAMINVNVEAVDGFGFVNLLGPSEQTLPELAQRVAAG